MITPDCLSVTKETAVAWEDLKPQVLAEIMDCLTKGEAPVIEPTTTETDDLIRNIVGLLNARIRPAIRKDGGDIAFRGFENGIVYVELQGKVRRLSLFAANVERRRGKTVKDLHSRSGCS